MTWFHRLRDSLAMRQARVRYVRAASVETRPMTPEEIAAFDAAFDKLADAFAALSGVLEGPR